MPEHPPGLLEQVFFSLDDDKFRQFNALLDAPPGPSPGLERLMAVKAPWHAPDLSGAPGTSTAKP